MAGPEQTLAPGTLIDGKYRLEVPLGEGTTGVVWRALHVVLGKRFALKFLHPARGTPQTMERFEREARALGRLSHPHIVAVSDFGFDSEVPPRPYLAMEYLDGVSLADTIARRGALSIAEALPLLAAIAEALNHAHERGVLHRDLKPGNVILPRDTAADGGPKVVDFGLAAIRDAGGHDMSPEASLADAASDALTHPGTLIGTPRYVAPELVRGRNATAASDIYSFGVLAYEVLAGRAPYEGTVREVLDAHLRGAVPDPTLRGAALPLGVVEVLRRLLAQDPAKRPLSAVAAVRELRAAAGQAVHGWKRPAAAGALALGLIAAAAMTDDTWAMQSLDRSLHDRLLQLLPAHAPDPRVLLVVLNEETLRADPTPLTERADELGDRVRRMFDAGARSVGVDFLLPVRWSESHRFAQLVLENADRIVLASFASPSGDIVGLECLSPLTKAALGPERVAALFGVVNIEADADGIVRRSRVSYLDEAGRPRPTWPAALVERAFAGGAPRAGRFQWIDHSIAWPLYERIAWHELDAVLTRDAGRFRDRLVLVGGDFPGDDAHRIPRRPGRPDESSGLVLQALSVDTLLSRRALGDLSRVGLAAIAAGLVAGFVAAGRGWPVGRWRLVAVLTVCAVSAGAVLTFRWTRLFVPAVPLVTLVVGVVLAVVIDSRLRHAQEKVL